MCSHSTCADPENFLRGGGGGSKFPEGGGGLTENFNMAKNNNLAFPGGGVRTPCPPSGSAHAVGLGKFRFENV